MLPQPPIQEVPYAEETDESRIGIQSGMLGADNVTRTFRVYTTKRQDNPIQAMELQIQRLRGGAMVGDRFPTTDGWGDGSYVLFNWTILAHHPGTNVWILQARYVPSYVTGRSTQLWSYRSKSSLESYLVYSDLDGKGIGLPKYVSYTSDTPSSFTTVNMDRGATPIKLALAGGGSDPFNKNLPRYSTGAERYRRTTVIVISKTLDNLDGYWDPYVTAIRNAKAVNQARDQVIIYTTARTNGVIELLDANNPGGMVLLQDIDLEPIVNEGGGSVPSYRVTITLKHDPGYTIGEGDDARWYSGFQEHRQHMMTDKEFGTESPVLFDGKPIIESWRVNDEANLSSIIGGFN